MQNVKRHACGCNHNKCQEGIISLIITSFSPSKFLETVKETLNYIPSFVSFFIEWPRLFRVYLWRDRIAGCLTLQIFPDLFCPISFVAKNIASFQIGKLLQQRNRLFTIVNIAGRQQKSHRPDIFANDRVYFCVQPAARFPDTA